MQCDILIPNLKNPKTIALMKENFENMSDGSSPHCAGALKLGFEKAFELKKREKGVQLQCSGRSCGWYNSPISYSSIGSGICCPHCISFGRGGCYLQCAGCKYRRTAIGESCQGCGKKFI
jgi:hypothetical protein